MKGMPGESRDILLEAAEETDVSHHAEIEDSSCLIASTRRQQLASQRFEHCFGHCVFVPMECRETSARSWIPELHLMIFGARYQETFRRMPVYRLCIPLMPSQH